MAIIKKYPVRVNKIINEVNGIYTLEIESLGNEFKYYPGQFLHLALDEYDPSAQWPDSRCFSIQSPPGTQYIKITFAVKGAFTSIMEKQIQANTELTLKMPYGDLFIREHNKLNTVFISGGTGITPFLSLFNDPSFINYVNPVLYAGFRNKNMNLYTSELILAKEINPGLRINHIYEDQAGMLDICSIFSLSNRYSSYFISGPPKMLKAFKAFLILNGVAEEQVLTDDWE